MALENTTSIEMWLGELDNFLEVWNKHEAVMLAMMSASTPIAKKKATKKTSGSSK